MCTVLLSRDVNPIAVNKLIKPAAYILSLAGHRKPLLILHKYKRPYIPKDLNLLEYSISILILWLFIPLFYLELRSSGSLRSE